RRSRTRSTSTCARTSPCRTLPCASGARACRPTSRKRPPSRRPSARRPRRWAGPPAAPPKAALSCPGSARLRVTCARWPPCRSARRPCSACSSWAARIPSASTPTWACSTSGGSASSAPPASARGSSSVGDDRGLAHEYLDALRRQRRLSPATVRNYGHALDRLFVLLEGRSPAALEPAQVRRFVAVLHAQGLAPRTLALTLSAWRGWFRWLARHKGFAANPALGIRAPKAPKPLPKALSVEQAQKLLDGTGHVPDGRESDSDRAVWLRDRAMFELLYSSGLRLGELVAIDLGDGRLDLAQGELTVTGKGAKTRTVPVG